MKLMIKGIIFDCDGVLLDSEPLFTIAVENLARDKGVPVDMTTLPDCNGITGRQFCKILLSQYPEVSDEPEAFIKEYYEYCDALLMSDELQPMKGIVEFARKQHAQGKKLAIASSSPEYYVRHKIALFGIEDCFDFIVSANDVTKSKPDPQVYLIACEKMKEKKEDLIVIEDAPNGIKAGKAAGLYVVGFKGSKLLQDTSLADEEVYEFADIAILKG